MVVKLHKDPQGYKEAAHGGSRVSVRPGRGAACLHQHDAAETHPPPPYKPSLLTFQRYSVPFNTGNKPLLRQPNNYQDFTFPTPSHRRLQSDHGGLVGWLMTCTKQ